jgi:hypothetical protein
MAAPSFLGPPLAGSGVASARGNGGAAPPPEVAKRLKMMNDKINLIGNRGGGPGYIGPPASTGSTPPRIGPPDTTGVNPTFGGVPPSMTSPEASMVMRILQGGSQPELYGVPMQRIQQPGYDFPNLSRLLFGMGGYNG